ncbi:hypothetical protein V5O48_013461 [Marasmius crinis-equi]|uniref:Uncharacterized protein n=1 Tax=Marasmius crinis-equi TaxID=585013 RepID=A0ABR3F053_9AGAR
MNMRSANRRTRSGGQTRALTLSQVGAGRKKTAAKARRGTKHPTAATSDEEEKLREVPGRTRNSKRPVQKTEEAVEGVDDDEGEGERDDTAVDRFEGHAMDSISGSEPPPRRTTRQDSAIRKGANPVFIPPVPQVVITMDRNHRRLVNPGRLSSIPEDVVHTSESENSRPPRSRSPTLATGSCSATVRSHDTHPQEHQQLQQALKLEAEEDDEMEVAEEDQPGPRDVEMRGRRGSEMSPGDEEHGQDMNSGNESGSDFSETRRTGRQQKDQKRRDAIESEADDDDDEYEEEGDNLPRPPRSRGRQCTEEEEDEEEEDYDHLPRPTTTRSRDAERLRLARKVNVEEHDGNEEVKETLPVPPPPRQKAKPRNTDAPDESEPEDEDEDEVEEVEEQEPPRRKGRGRTKLKRREDAVVITEPHDGDETGGEEEDDEDEDEDAADTEKTYKTGPLPDWAKDRAEELYQRYYEDMDAIAKKVRKPLSTLFAHVNDLRPASVRACNPWNAFSAWYTENGEFEKPKDCSLQDWNGFVCDAYDKEVKSRVAEEDLGIREVVREAMQEYIDWFEERQRKYLEAVKEDPAKARRHLHKVVTPFLKSAQQVWIEHGVHVFGYAMSTRQNNTSMGPSVVWGVGPEFKAVKERCQSSLSRSIEDLTTAFHVEQMEGSQAAADVLDLFEAMKPGPNPKETGKMADRRFLAKMIKHDVESLLGSTGKVAINSFLEHAYRLKLVLRNWPTKVGVPGIAGLKSNSLGTSELRAVVSRRMEYVQKALKNQLQEGDKCLKHVHIELWDEDDINANMMAQRTVAIVTDESGTVLVKAEQSKSFQQALVDSADSDDAEEAPTVAKGKGKNTAPPPRIVKSNSRPKPALPLWADDEDEVDDTQPPPAAGEIHQVPPPAKTSALPPPAKQPALPPTTKRLDLPATRKRPALLPTMQQPSIPPSIPPAIQRPAMPVPVKRRLASSTPVTEERRSLPSKVVEQSQLRELGGMILEISPERRAPVPRVVSRGINAPIPQPHTTFTYGRPTSNIAQELREWEARQARELHAQRTEHEAHMAQRESERAEMAAFWEAAAVEYGERPTKKRKLDVLATEQLDGRDRPVRPLPVRGRGPDVATTPAAHPPQAGIQSETAIAGPSRLRQNSTSVAESPRYPRIDFKSGTFGGVLKPKRK